MNALHIESERLWNYVNFKAELSTEEETHLAECPQCMDLFKLCVLTDSPDTLPKDDLERSA